MDIERFLYGCIFGKKIQKYYYMDNVQGFAHDKRTHDTAKSQCKNAIKRLGNISLDEFITASKQAWSGRIEWTGNGIEYTAGQFYNIEAPQAMAAVLQRIEDNRTK